MIALVVTVPVSEAELAADALWGLGVVAIEERHPDGGVEGMVELWTSLGDDVEHVIHEAEAFPPRWRWHTVEVDDSVAATWRQHAVPSWITPDLVVVPSWIDSGAFDDDVITVRIDPADTFGLGDHPSTVLTLRALRGLLWHDATVLDVGCGSGVVAVGAALLGASYVEAVDISAAAVATTTSNAVRNGVEGAIVASTTALVDIAGPFDIVCANILAPVLIELAPQLRRLTAPAGVLIVSGILDAAHEHVLEALEPMQVVDHLTREGWAAVVLRH